MVHFFRVQKITEWNAIYKLSALFLDFPVRLVTDSATNSNREEFENNV